MPSNKTKLALVIEEARAHIADCKECARNPDGCRAWRSLWRAVAEKHLAVLWDCVLWHRHRGVPIDELFTKLKRIVRAVGGNTFE